MILKLLFAFISSVATAQTQHTLVRRVSVFPIKFSLPELAPIADDAWWDLRDALARDKRFLIASKNFLMQKDVYQARATLEPAAAIILGKLLDANALVTTFLEDRVLRMRVYEGEYGRVLWQHDLTLQPSLPVAQQLKAAVVKLAQDFLASIPYQGFVVIDPLKGQPLYQEGRRLMVRADVGEGADVQIGDPAQLIHIFSDNLKPLFTEGASIQVFAEGRVVERSRETIVIELDRLNKMSSIPEGTLVRLPKEIKRLEELYSIQDSLHNKIDPTFLSPGMTSAKQRVAENKPLLASLAFIGNLAAFLLPAF